MTPIGRGQRQLIIGDRKTGKTAVCIDTILNQKANWESGDKDKQVRCIYVAIGQKGSTIAGVRKTLEEQGALDYTTIVAAPGWIRTQRQRREPQILRRPVLQHRRQRQYLQSPIRLVLAQLKLQ